jgi:hypothetical protein
VNAHRRNAFSEMASNTICKHISKKRKRIRNVNVIDVSKVPSSAGKVYSASLEFEKQDRAYGKLGTINIVFSISDRRYHILINQHAAMTSWSIILRMVTKKSSSIVIFKLLQRTRSPCIDGVSAICRIDKTLLAINTG